MKGRYAVPLAIGGAKDRFEEMAFRIGHPVLRRAGHRGLAPDTLDQAIAAGLAFLSSTQRPDGSWRGFALYPGASSAWITAHVAFVLEAVSQATPLCRRAADYLASVGEEQGGWGWNHRTRIDIDSSALALLVLDRFEVPTHPRLMRRVMAAQHPEGGFPTYAADSDGTRRYGWQEGHPEVTAVVVELLERTGEPPRAKASAVDWLESKLVEGVVPSYWWEGWAYGLWIQGRIGHLGDRAAARLHELLPKTSLVPDLAMLSTAAMLWEGEPAVTRAGLLRLLKGQRRDGSWRCHPTLRVTVPSCRHADPWAPGRLYADRRRVFSTAHAVAALALARGTLERWTDDSAIRAERGSAGSQADRSHQVR